MILSFADKETKALFELNVVSKIPADIQRAALRKLKMLNGSASLADLRIPPASRLEKLKGKRAGQYSIRINDQWRICFEFENGHASKVEIADYH